MARIRLCAALAGALIALAAPVPGAGASGGHAQRRSTMTRIWIALVALFTVLPVAVEAAPQGKIVIAQGVDPTTLDPMNHQETPAGNVCRNMFDTLLERDADLKMQPALAREMPKLVAPTVWEFTLRPAMKFHNGEPVDAEAVKFSLERLVDPKNKMRGSPPFAPLRHF